MRIFLLGAALALVMTSAALADDPMSNLYGNTVISKGGLAETHSYYNADHSFTMKAPSFGMEWKGTWKLDGASLCRTFDSPPPGVANPLCTAVEPHKLGDTWTATANGETRTVTLVKGIQ